MTKKPILLVVTICALVLAATASAALEPGVYDPNSTGCPTATFSAGVLHLAKNCPTATVAAAGADITGLTGQTFTSASFTLANATQCQGGSPRFDVVTTTGTFFLGCNNVAATPNANGTVTYTFDAASIAAAGGQVPFPTGTITAVDVLIDVQGTADVSNITVNGVLQVPSATTGGTPTTRAACKHGGWKTFTSPSFKNQGQCVSYVNHHSSHGKSKPQDASHGKSNDAIGATHKPKHGK
jgi:hypothetical protein